MESEVCFFKLSPMAPNILFSSGNFSFFFYKEFGINQNKSRLYCSRNVA